MSSTIGRGEFTAGGDNKGFDYSLLMDGEDVEVSSSPEPQAKAEVLAPAVSETLPGDDDSWNTFHKPQHQHQRKDSTGKSAARPPGAPSHLPMQQQRKPRPFPQQQNGAAHHVERQPIVLAEETTIEMYEFPAALRTADLRKLLSAFEGRYRIKWNNDTSCWVVFNNAEDATAALDITDEYVKIRRYDPSLHPAATETEQPQA